LETLGKCHLTFGLRWLWSYCMNRISRIQIFKVIHKWDDHICKQILILFAWKGAKELQYLFQYFCHSFFLKYFLKNIWYFSYLNKKLKSSSNFTTRPIVAKKLDWEISITFLFLPVPERRHPSIVYMTSRSIAGYITLSKIQHQFWLWHRNI
jgi:hypothetical protein